MLCLHVFVTVCPLLTPATAADGHNSAAGKGQNSQVGVKMNFKRMDSVLIVGAE